MQLTLFGYWRSSASWRVRIGLHLKGLPFRYASVHLVRDGGEQHMDAHRARNPMRQVPVLQVGEGPDALQLTQSLPILEWLHETVEEGPPLLPDDPLHRYRARQYAEVVNAGIQPLQNLAVLQAVDALGGDKVVWAREAIARGLQALEDLRAGRDGTFMVGDRPTVADACLVPQLYNARRFGVDLSTMPTLLGVESACAALPAFEAAHPDAQPDAQP